jgi:glycosyltransferase involved in cell wall biosynthesis
MPNTPRVSLIVPCFNEPPDVLRASLASLRGQSFADFECIIVDESTSDESAQTCRNLCELDGRFVYLHPEQRLGLARSLNLGLEHSKGEFVARFDSDDICMPDRLSTQVSFLDANPTVSVLGGGLEIIDDSGRSVAFREYPARHDEIARGMQLTNSMAHPTVMFRRSITVEHGAYDPSFAFSEDLELWLRWINRGVVFANVPEVLVRYRQQVTRRSKKHWKFNLRARVKNFKASHLSRRLLGILLIGLWTSLPARVQEGAFRFLMFRHKA